MLYELLLQKNQRKFDASVTENAYSYIGNETVMTKNRDIIIQE